jgi:hypothetical protein
MSPEALNFNEVDLSESGLEAALREEITTFEDVIEEFGIQLESVDPHAASPELINEIVSGVKEILTAVEAANILAEQGLGSVHGAVHFDDLSFVHSDAFWKQYFPY